MDSSRILIVAIIALAVLLAWRFKLRSERRHRKASGVNGSVRSRDNYNLDIRRFRLEKLKQTRWVAWLVGGTIVCMAPIAFGAGSVAIGLAVCWVLLVLALSGVVMSGQAPRQDILKKHGLARLPDGPPPRQLVQPFVWTKLFGGVAAEEATHIMFGRNGRANWWLFRYAFEYAVKNKRKQLYEYSVCAVVIERSIPRLVIDGGDVYDFTEFIPSEDREPIRLEGSFGKRYTMYVPAGRDSENRLLAMSVMTPDVMDLYERHFGASAMIIEANTVLLLTRRDLFENHAYEDFYVGLEEFVTKLVRQTTIRGNVGKLLKA